MWHPRHKVRRLPGASVPPASTGTTWSHSSWPAFPQRVQRQPSRSRILSRNRFHAARAVRLIRSCSERCASDAAPGGRARRRPAPARPRDRPADGARWSPWQGEGWRDCPARPPLPPGSQTGRVRPPWSTARLPSRASCRSAPMSCVDWLQTGRRGMILSLVESRNSGSLNRSQRSADGPQPRRPISATAAPGVVTRRPSCTISDPAFGQGLIAAPWRCVLALAIGERRKPGHDRRTPPRRPLGHAATTPVQDCAKPPGPDRPRAFPPLADTDGTRPASNRRTGEQHFPFRLAKPVQAPRLERWTPPRMQTGIPSRSRSTVRRSEALTRTDRVCPCDHLVVVPRRVAFRRVQDR